MQTGNELAEIALGFHQFEERSRQGSGVLDAEGFISIYCGGDRVVPRRYRSWDAVRADLAELAARSGEGADNPRAVLLAGMIKSLDTAARYYSGKSIPFETMVQDLVGGVTGTVPEDTLAEIGDELDALLVRRGIAGRDLGERLRAWRETNLLDQDRVEAVFRELLAVSKARTNKMVFDTGDYDIRLNWFEGLPFGARCDFDNGKMDINPAMRFTRAELKNLVCHEVYPGHSTHMLFTRAEVDAGRSEKDALLCAANALDGCIQEGIGDQGIRIIDWIEDLDDAIAFQLRRLRNGAKTSAAWRLMHDGWSDEAVASYLAQTAFSDEAGIRAFLLLAKHPFRGPFVSSYWTGSEAVGEVWDRLDTDGRARFIPFLCGQLQSPASVRMFQ